MSKVIIGTSSWADRSLLADGSFYPAEIKTPAGRLRYYSSQFPLAEIDSSYHYFPTKANLSLWLENTPSDFVFDIRAFSLFTGHPTPPHAIPRSIRGKHAELADHKGSLYPHHVPEDVTNQLWNIFVSYARAIDSAGKMGLILFQFPTWFHANPENYDYIAACKARLPEYHLAVEFRTGDWLAGENLEKTLSFLRQQELALVCVDEPQGLKTSVPPVAEVTSKVGMIRFQGRNVENWEKTGIPAEKRFHYLYTEEELQAWVPDIRRMERQAEVVHIIFKNKWGSYPVINARQLMEILAKPD